MQMKEVTLKILLNGFYICSIVILKSNTYYGYLNFLFYFILVLSLLNCYKTCYIYTIFKALTKFFTKLGFTSCTYRTQCFFLFIIFHTSLKYFHTFSNISINFIHKKVLCRKSKRAKNKSFNLARSHAVTNLIQ